MFDKDGKGEIVLFACAMALSACVTGAAKPETPAQRVYALQADLQTALIAGIAYSGLPGCGANPQPCSDARTVIRIDMAAHQARNAIASAQELATSGLTGTDAAIRAAQLAIQALKEIAR